MAIPAINIILFAAFSALLLSTPTFARNTLFSGDTLNPGQSLSQGSYLFIMQTDCNLVLYDINNVIWATGTNGKATGCYLAMQNDGNLVIYSGSRVIWASNTNRATGSFELAVQSDRNVVIYALPSRTAIWATGTNVRGTAGAVIAEGNSTAGKGK